jgi:multisubunit Na+/H+ antiporter MnhC subunit
MTDPERARRGAGYGVHDRLTRVLSSAMIVIGVLLLARGALMSIVLGVLFVVAGIGRLYVQSTQRRGGPD